ncbi:hypothetical protein J4558_25295 [Leptolyngbya sp. 15MV]|nr:hypothetical protein J4558_25295 [Leptolyngbya sp. 15MV]
MLGRIFKAYDIRGTYPDLLNETMAWQIGFGSSKFLRAEAEAAGDTTPMMRNIVVGHDMRKSSPALVAQLIKGITEQGGDVIDVGLVDTPFIYFAINHLDCAGGIMTTASHNPPQYNGFKISKRKAKPVGEATGLADIRKHAAMVDKATLVPQSGRVEKRDLWKDYIAHVRHFLDLGGKKIKVVVDASNGMAGTMVPRVFGPRGKDIPGLTIVELNFDNTRGEFVHEPNPLVPANLRQLQDAVIAEKANLGICFDGDADRCGVVDEKGAEELFELELELELLDELLEELDELLELELLAKCSRPCGAPAAFTSACGAVGTATRASAVVAMSARPVAMAASGAVVRVMESLPLGSLPGRPRHTENESSARLFHPPPRAARRDRAPHRAARASRLYQPSEAMVWRRMRSRVRASSALSARTTPPSAASARRNGITCTSGVPRSITCSPSAPVAKNGRCTGDA